MDDRIKTAVSALKQFAAKPAGDRKQLPLRPDGDTVLLLVSAVKMAPNSRIQSIKIPLERGFRSENDICLFVKDLQRGIRVDHEPSTQHWREVLRRANVSRINKVMPLRELRAEYGMYEARRKLCDSYDLFLSDVSVVGLLPAYIGKHFYKKHKLPIPVNLSSSDLASHIDKCIDTAYLRLFNTGPCSSIEIGCLSQSSDDLLLNIATAIDVLAVKYPGGLRNIRSIHIKLHRSPALPVYLNNVSSNKVPRPAATTHHWLDKQPVRGELSTSEVAADVIVYPSGDVSLVEKKSGKKKLKKKKDVDASGKQSKKKTAEPSKKLQRPKLVGKNESSKKVEKKDLDCSTEDSKKGKLVEVSKKLERPKVVEKHTVSKVLKKKDINCSPEDSKKRKLRKVSKKMERPKPKKMSSLKSLKTSSERPGAFATKWKK